MVQVRIGQFSLNGVSLFSSHFNRQEEKQMNRPPSVEGELPPISRSSSPTAAEKDILVRKHVPLGI